MEMQFTNNMYRQGDVQIITLAAMPTTGVTPTEKQFLAASERSGSMHALFGKYKQYAVDGGVVLECEEDCIMNHSLTSHLNGLSMDEVRELPKKDHDAITIPKGIHFVSIQQQFDPMSGFKTPVRD